MKLFRRGDIKSAHVPENFLEKFKRSIVAGISGIALASAFGLGMPSVAHAEEGVADTNTTPEMTYEMSNDEVSEITDGGFSETVTADVTDYSESNASETSYIEEQPVVEESAPAEQTAVEESTSAEQTTVEESTSSEQTTVEESTSTEQTTVEESTSTEQTTVEDGGLVQDLSSDKNSGSNMQSTSESSSKSGLFKHDKFIVNEDSSDLEIYGKKVMIIDSSVYGSDEKTLSQMLEEWRINKYPNSSFSDFIYFDAAKVEEPGRYDLQGIDAHIIVKEDGTTTIVKNETSKSESFEETVEAQVTEETKTVSQDKQESTEKQNEIISKTIAYNDTDYVVVTGKDGSVTIVTMVPLSAEKVMIIKNDLIKSGKMSSNTPMNLKTLVQNGETIIGDSIITRGKDGSLGIIGSDFESIEALNNKVIADYMSERNEKDANGHIDDKKVKADNPDIPNEPNKEIPPVEPNEPSNPNEPNKEIPPVESDKEKPPVESNEQGNSNREETHTETLAKTGDPSNPLAAGVVAAAGLGAIAFGVKRREDNKDSGKGLDDDPVLNNTEYQNDVAIVERAKHFSKNQRDRIKDELYKEYSSQIANDSKKGPKHLAK